MNMEGVHSVNLMLCNTMFSGKTQIFRSEEASSIIAEEYWERMWKFELFSLFCLLSCCPQSEAKNLWGFISNPINTFSAGIPVQYPVPQHQRDNLNLHTLLPYTSQQRSLILWPQSPKALCPQNHICRSIFNMWPWAELKTLRMIGIFPSLKACTAVVHVSSFCGSIWQSTAFQWAVEACSILQLSRR